MNPSCTLHTKPPRHLSAISQCEWWILPRTTPTLARTRAYCTQSLFHLSLGFCLMISKSFCKTLKVVLYAFIVTKQKSLHTINNIYFNTRQWSRRTSYSLKVAYDWIALWDFVLNWIVISWCFKLWLQTAQRAAMNFCVRCKSNRSITSHTFYDFTASSTWMNDTSHWMKTALQTWKLCK